MSRLPRQLEGLARLLTYILCHRPDEFGLVLAEDGSAPLKQVLQVVAAEPGWGFVRRRHLEELVQLLTPPRFELQDDRLRALEPGPAKLRRAPGEAPPALLYIAITPKAHPRVWEEGLKAAPGREVVLAASRELALKMGKRRAPEPVLVIVQARAAAKAGVQFAGYGEGLYLTTGVAREFLQLPAPPEIPAKAKPEAAAPPRPVPGGFTLDISQMLQKPERPRGKKGEPAWKSGARALRRKRRG